MLLWLPGQVVLGINWDFHNQLSEVIGSVYPLPNQPLITIRKTLYTVYEFHLFFTFAQVKVHEIQAFFKSFDYGPLSSAFFLCFWVIKFSFFFNYEIIILKDNTQVSN